MALLDALFERFERAGLPVPRSLVLFVAVGLVGLFVHTGLFSLLFHAGRLDKSEAWLAALAMATVVTWALNRRLTFAATGRRSAAEIFRYALVTAVSQGISYGVFMGVSSVLPHLPPQVALLTGAVTATVFSYTGQRFFTFAAYKPTEVVAIGDTPVLVAAGQDRPL